MSSPPPSPSANDTLVHEQQTNGKRKQEHSSQDAPTKKRAKLSGTSSFTRHPVFWAADGSVFIQFGETRMKLYRNRLALHSEWFQELFDNKVVVSSGGVEESIPWATVDGVDLFQLDATEIALKDFEAVLTTLENAVNFCYTKPTFAFIASLVRAASFFRFRKILDFAVTYLEGMFSEDMKAVTKEPLPVTHATEVILLGRDWNLPQLLKRAFYELARAPGTEVHHINLLDKDDLALLINLQKHLAKAWLRILAFYRPSCSNSPACRTSRCTLSMTDKIVQNYRLDPIVGLDELRGLDWKRWKLCSACVNHRVKWLEQETAKLWDNMDGWLNLNPIAEANNAGASD
ncbi:hypothetical protein BDN72DRAFT_962445 [Pluteus cervinus]|uniref:Uncharacterized protein n=1 Tax=Pluteus cervinus TaxID=181527 RepID=A0ACD3AIE1_9AGAR|nr:hypothetical protein BDN72DRAFT_962445 [Pluteus cervinus]